MVDYIAVIPYAYKPYHDEFLATSRLHSLDIDNTETNRGIAESWNLGIDRLREENCDWLVVVSAAIRFGHYGGLDMIGQIERHPEAQIIHFATAEVPEQKFIRGKSPGYAEGVLGWHLTAIRRDVIDAVGYFDPNFFPCYFEDIDYDLRVNKAIPEVNWLILPVEARGESLRHAIELGGVESPAEPLIAYFATKWGRHPSAQLPEYDHPFNDPENSMAYFPAAHGRSWQ